MPTKFPEEPTPEELIDAWVAHKLIPIDKLTMSTDHTEVIARVVAGEDIRDIGLCPCHWYTARDLLAVLAVAGLVVVPKPVCA